MGISIDQYRAAIGAGRWYRPVDDQGNFLYKGCILALLCNLLLGSGDMGCTVTACSFLGILSIFIVIIGYIASLGIFIDS